MTYIKQKIMILYSLKLERDQARIIVERRLNFVSVRINKSITIMILQLCPKMYLMETMMIIMLLTKMIMIIIKMMLKIKENSK